jgi:hypothetical protein
MFIENIYIYILFLSLLLFPTAENRHTAARFPRHEKVIHYIQYTQNEKRNEQDVERFDDLTIRGIVFCLARHRRTEHAENAGAHDFHV